jgi:hypothetical protein
VDAIERGQINVFNTNSDLLFRLRDVLVDYEQIAEPTDILKYSKIQLWALYVGSPAEQVADLKSRGVSADHGWYNTRLTRHARIMGLICWQDVRAVLQSIHH